uniref:Uncharacterized protein n=1 Tax=Arundo donax TaxID=35708 RepID=A0A0A9AFC1_ARUDO
MAAFGALNPTSPPWFPESDTTFSPLRYICSVGSGSMLLFVN